MNQDVKTCVDAKLNVFKDYFTVPADVQPDMDQLAMKIEALGEASSDAMDFESRFATQLQDEYNGMFLRCTARPVQMTAEQKAESKRLADELQYGTSDPKKVAQMKLRDTAKDVADIAKTELEQEAISMRRRAMIESGTFDDYTRATNKVDDAIRGAKFLGGLFKKK